MNMMRMTQLFSTPVWTKELNIDLDPVKKLCLELKENDFPNRVLSNVGGWQSNNINLNNYDELKELKEELDIALEDLSITIHPNFRCRLDNAWININEKGHHNSRHVHPVTAIAGTFYVQTTPDAGAIVFYKETEQRHYPFNSFNSPMFATEINLEPQNNLLVLFPSWVDHWVNPSESDIPRISISFNICQIGY